MGVDGHGERRQDGGSIPPGSTIFDSWMETLMTPEERAKRFFEKFQIGYSYEANLADEFREAVADIEKRTAYYKDILEVAALEGCDEIKYGNEKAMNCQEDTDIDEPYCVPCRAAIAVKE